MKKVLTIALMFLILVGLVACGDNAADTKTSPEKTQATAVTTAAEPAKTAVEPAKTAAEPEKTAAEVEKTVFPCTVTDQVGRQVEIKAAPQRVCSMYSVAITYLTALGAQDKLISKSEGIFSPCLYDYIAPEIVKLPIAGSKKPDLEIVAKLNSDIYLGRGRDKDALEAVENLGIPAIGIAPETIEQVFETYDLMGKLLGKEERAAELKQAYTDIVDKAAAIVKDIPEDKRATAVLMGGSIGKLANSSMLQSFLIETAGGINLAADIGAAELWPTVGVEQIFEWNPDFIFITSYGATDYTPEDIMKDKTWSGVTAVKNNHVLKTPGALESWELPGPSSALGVLWMLHQMYPDSYSDEELQKDVENYYQILYPNNTFTRELLGY